MVLQRTRSFNGNDKSESEGMRRSSTGGPAGPRGAERRQGGGQVRRKERRDSIWEREEGRGRAGSRTGHQPWANFDRARSTGPYLMMSCGDEVESQFSSSLWCSRERRTHPEERHHEHRDAGQERRARADAEDGEVPGSEEREGRRDRRAEEVVGGEVAGGILGVAARGKETSERTPQELDDEDGRGSSPHRDVDHDALEREEDTGKVKAGADDGRHPAREREKEEGRKGGSGRLLADLASYEGRRTSAHSRERSSQR